MKQWIKICIYFKKYIVAVCRAALTSVKSGKPEEVKYPKV